MFPLSSLSPFWQKDAHALVDVRDLVVKSEEKEKQRNETQKKMNAKEERRRGDEKRSGEKVGCMELDVSMPSINILQSK